MDTPLPDSQSSRTWKAELANGLGPERVIDSKDCSNPEELVAFVEKHRAELKYLVGRGDDSKRLLCFTAPSGTSTSVYPRELRSRLGEADIPVFSESEIREMAA